MFQTTNQSVYQCLSCFIMISRVDVRFSQNDQRFEPWCIQSHESAEMTRAPPWWHLGIRGNGEKTVALGFKLSTFTTQNAKRTFWNACSERIGVFSGFMDPRSVRILFLLPAKRIHSSTWSFSRSFQAVQEQNLQALTCTILLKPGKKRIRLWPAERFLKALKKGSVFGLPSAF